ncbi:MAG: MgtC/SapB family protein [Actinomycetota bacterium]|nr:MgtC/SapB family protein [Actinomycetota bacterium]
MPVASEGVLIARVAVGVGLSFAVGFEREVRGASAGDRTFSVVGISAAAVAAAVVTVAPNAIAGVLTGVGFIGAGLVFRAGEGTVRGVTTASAIFACTAIGVVAGTGHLLLAVFVAAVVLLLLELPYVPVLNRLDGSRYRRPPKDDT